MFRNLFLVFLATAAALSAQTIAWTPPGGRIAVGQTVQFQLICRDCQPTATPVPPKVDGLILRYQGTTSSFDYTSGGAATAQVSFVFLAHWSKNANLVIPSFSVVTNRGSVTVPEAVFEPAAATVGESGKPLSSAASARLEARPTEVWAGRSSPWPTGSRRTPPTNRILPIPHRNGAPRSHGGRLERPGRIQAQAPMGRGSASRTGRTRLRAGPAISRFSPLGNW